MATQIILAWTVLTAGTVLDPAGAATALAAVPLVQDPITDPVLGQFLGLTVDSDTTTAGSDSATRTLTLNMAGGNAPPPFPCHPITATPPTPPYPLVKAVTLAGTFAVTNGLASVPTSDSQVPAGVKLGSTVQFMSQQGVFYQVLSVGPTSITLVSAYTGITGTTTASIEKEAPAKNPAVYSTSDLDTSGVATTPAIPAGSGGQTVEIEYLDSTGAGPFTTVVSLTGRRPAAVPLAGGSVDIAAVINMFLTAAGAFGNSIGQITLVDLESPLPSVPSTATPEDFVELTDEAQLLIDRALVYTPASYFSLANQTASQGASPTTPTNTELATPLAAFVAPETAMPPPFPPQTPSTVPTPTFLSGLYTQTIQNALAGVPVIPSAIAFA